MSAHHLKRDWRFERASSAIRSGTVLDFGYYAELFETDEEEVIEIFHIVACELGARIVVDSNKTKSEHLH